MQQLPQSQDSAPLRGLSTQQAEALRAQGLSNQQSDTGGKSAGEIIRSNALTFFNLIFVVIAVLLCLVGSYRNLTFLPVVIGNTLIGMHLKRVAVPVRLSMKTIGQAPVTFARTRPKYIGGPRAQYE